jgi:4-hydroxythreonine-4-phosphate dehydrogenase
LNNKPLRIALTPGEPAGIGPDLCLQLIQQPQAAELVAVCDPDLLAERAATLKLPVNLRTLDAGAEPRGSAAGELCVLPVSLRVPVRCGQVDPGNSPYVLDTLDHAITGCRDGTFAALVTGPVHKGVINEAGIRFSGHTEYLAEATGTAGVVMLLATEGLRVALVTTHVPLSEVSRLITAERVGQVLATLHAGLRRDLGITAPRITVCGLNPHAGEGGHLGHEEIDTLIPLLDELRIQGLDLTGPLPADTVFTRDRLAQTDAVLAMYHDQGLPVIKHMGFGTAVNITLGLPIIRTSVDHGTALDLAGTGKGDPGSLQAALLSAVDIARRHAEKIQTQTGCG